MKRSSFCLRRSSSGGILGAGVILGSEVEREGRMFAVADEAERMRNHVTVVRNIFDKVRSDYPVSNST